MRSLLGTRSTTAEVAVGRIPYLEEGFRVAGSDEFALIGDAPKVYLISHSIGERQAYIAKAARREGPIECATEYLISRIGAHLPLRIAEGRLVRLRSPSKATDVRFLSRQFLNRSLGEQLVHGSELVARCFEIKGEELYREVPKGHEWGFYTVDLIDQVLASIATHGEGPRLRAAFARMMAFDAIIGANDRHPQNWGVITTARTVGPLRFAPIFDTARGLFWNHHDPRLEAWDREGSREEKIEHYANRSVPLIGLERASRPNHFDVLAEMASDARFRAPIVQVLRAYDPDTVTRLLHLEFRHLLARRRLEYVDALLRFRHARLGQVSRV
jgi:hypothetical protein